MYICSFLLFISASAMLYIGVKNFKKSVYDIKKYKTDCYVLRQGNNYSFQEHHLLQQNVNLEIGLKKKAY